MNKKIIKAVIKQSSKLFYSITLTGFVISFLSHCSATPNSVIASTGTTIGVELSENPSSQSISGVLGYKRAELAYVPTNKSSAKKTTTSTDAQGKVTTIDEDGSPSVKNGASDSANVLMELKYKSIFSFKNGGIYQRLAVGNLAVQQPGAALMFAKNDNGTIDPSTAKYMAAAEVMIKEELTQIEKIVAYVADGSGAINKKTLTDLVAEAKIKAPNIFTDTGTIPKITSLTNKTELENLLYDPLEAAIAPLYQSLPKDKQ
jgi:hypothetical protein